MGGMTQHGLEKEKCNLQQLLRLLHTVTPVSSISRGQSGMSVSTKDLICLKAPPF